MVLGFLAFAMMIGAVSAGAVWALGYPVLAALAAYSAAGVLGVLGLALWTVMRSGPRRGPARLGTAGFPV